MGIPFKTELLGLSCASYRYGGGLLNWGSWLPFHGKIVVELSCSHCINFLLFLESDASASKLEAKMLFFVPECKPMYANPHYASRPF